MKILTMTSKICGVDGSQHNIFLTALILYVMFQIAACSSRDDCQNTDGFNMFWDEQEQECKQCLRCNAGYGLNKECGDGEGKGAECVECEVGFYSDSYDYGFCRPCQTCPNAKVAKECTSQRNRECGECDPGYYKHLYGTCEKCTNEEECAEYSLVTNAYNPTIPVPRRVPVLLDDQGASENSNSTGGGDGLLYAAIVLPIIATVLIVILLVIVVFMKRGSAQLKRQRQDEENRGRDEQDDNSRREEVEETTNGGLSRNKLITTNEGFTGTPNMERATVQSGSGTEESGNQHSHNESQETVPLLPMNGDAPVQTTDVQSDKSELVIDKNATTEQYLSQDSQKDIDSNRGNERNQLETGNVVTQRDEEPNPESMHNVKKCGPEEDKKLKERERAIVLAKDKSISKDMSYEITHKICQYFENNQESYRILASRVGMEQYEVNSLSGPKQVLNYMQTSMEGKRDIARLITELIDLPRFDIVDDVVCPWVLGKYDSEKEDQKS